jgi:hypothetical protein
VEKVWGGKMNEKNEQMNKKMGKKEKHSGKKIGPQLPVAHAHASLPVKGPHYGGY